MAQIEKVVEHFVDPVAAAPLPSPPVLPPPQSPVWAIGVPPAAVGGTPQNPPEVQPPPALSTATAAAALLLALLLVGLLLRLSCSLCLRWTRSSRARPSHGIGAAQEPPKRE